MSINKKTYKTIKELAQSKDPFQSLRKLPKVEGGVEAFTTNQRGEINYYFSTKTPPITITTNSITRKVDVEFSSAITDDERLLHLLFQKTKIEK